MSNPETFYNLSESDMTFEQVVERLIAFMKKDPRAIYTLSIGTDSHVHQKETRFISAIHLHRKGRGAWGCLKNVTIRRPILSLREKISHETALSQEIACMFTSDVIDQFSTILLPYIDEGADLNVEIHLDIGRKGLTKELIQEMVGRITSMGLEAKIKPDSYCASSYANKYTK
jgi:uncharacterized protein